MTPERGATFTIDARNPIDPRWDGVPVHFETHFAAGETLGRPGIDKSVLRLSVDDGGTFAVTTEDPTRYNSVREPVAVGVWTRATDPTSFPEPPDVHS